ncbi:hypothetical protein D3C80_1717490 [compost metagenome]
MQSDTAVIPLFEQYAAPLRLMLGPRSETLARQLKTFDFDGALLTLRQCEGAYEPQAEAAPSLPDGPSLPPGPVKGDKGLNH